MKYNILFFPNKEGRLRCRIRWGNRQCDFNVGYKVDCSKWVKATQRCRNNTFHPRNTPASVINMRLQEIELAISKLFLLPEEPTKEAILSAIGREPKAEKAIPEKVTDLYEKFINEESIVSGWSKNTCAKQRVYLTHLSNFKSNLLISELDASVIEQYVLYHIAVGHENYTIKKTIAHFRWFLRWAQKKGYDFNQNCLDFKVRLKEAKKPIFFLTWDELMTVWNKIIEKSYLARTRDLFCFCCFTSLRYSDASKLKKTDIQDDYFTFVSEKTNDHITIELNKYSKEILERYSNTDSELALPAISIQKYNEYLKELGELCDLNAVIKYNYIYGNEKKELSYKKWEILSSHVARRTFISNAIMMGIPADVVMKWTGHSDYKAMRPYVDIADQAKKKAMELFNK